MIGTMNVPLRMLIILLAASALANGCHNPEKTEPRPSTSRTISGERIVSLAPNLTEIVCAVGAGDHLVGRTDACNYPPEALRDIPIIGGFGQPSLEQLAKINPTLVLDVDLADETIGTHMEALGIRRERIVCHSLDDIPTALEQVGARVNHAEEAKRLAEAMRSGIQERRAACARLTDRPRVYVEIWNDPFTTVGRTSFVGDLVNAAGGKNIGDESDKEYYQVSAEWVVGQNPDVILCLYMSPGAPAKEQVLARTGWDHVSAIRRGRVYSDFNNDILLRPGPRVLEGIDTIHRRIFEN